MPLSYKEALKMAEELDITLLPYELAGGMEATREVIRQIKSGQSVGIFIGPEGGFELEEVDAAVREHVNFVPAKTLDVVLETALLPRKRTPHTAPAKTAELCHV